MSACDLLSAIPELSATPCTASAPAGSDAGVALSSTLRAIGAKPIEAAGAIRLSLGWYTDETEVEQAADALVEAWRKLI